MKKFLKSRSELKTTFPVENVSCAPMVTSRMELMVPVLPPLPPYPPLPAPYMQKKTLCKDYLKGRCIRPVCRFSHVRHLRQRKSVFKFCNDYQNGRCTRPLCKYVHADIFEEARFYRTGVLPPHTTSRHRRAPPPPPPEETLPQQDTTMNFPYPPPVIPPIVEPVSLMSCIPPSDIGARPVQAEFKVPLPPPNTSHLNRAWSYSENFGSAPPDLEPEHLAKKCKNCEIMEYRLKDIEKVEKLIRSAEEFNKRISFAKLVAPLLGMLNEEQGHRNSDSRLSSLVRGDRSTSWSDGLINQLVTSNKSAHNDNEILQSLQYGEFNLANLIKLIYGSRDHITSADTRGSYASAPKVRMDCSTRRPTPPPECFPGRVP